MGIPVSLILIAAGAILAWGVTDEPSGLDLDAIGVVLIVVGIIGFILTLLLWRSWWGPGYWSHAGYVEGGAPAPRRYGGQWGRRTTTYVEDDAPPPRTTYVEEAPPPPGGPPPPP